MKERSPQQDKPKTEIENQIGELKHMVNAVSSLQLDLSERLAPVTGSEIPREVEEPPNLDELSPLAREIQEAVIGLRTIHCEQANLITRLKL